MGAWRVAVRSSFEFLTPRVFRGPAGRALLPSPVRLQLAPEPAPRPVPIRRERFRDRRQKIAVCRTLLARSGLERFWSSDGPVLGEELDLRRALATLPSDALKLLLVCWALWDETGILAVSDLLHLEAAELAAVGELLRSIAQGPDEIDGWLARWAPAEA